MKHRKKQLKKHKFQNVEDWRMLFKMRISMGNSKNTSTFWRRQNAYMEAEANIKQAKKQESQAKSKQKQAKVI